VLVASSRRCCGAPPQFPDRHHERLTVRLAPLPACCYKVHRAHARAIVCGTVQSVA